MIKYTTKCTGTIKLFINTWIWWACLFPFICVCWCSVNWPINNKVQIQRKRDKWNMIRLQIHDLLGLVSGWCTAFEAFHICMMMAGWKMLLCSLFLQNIYLIASYWCYTFSHSELNCFNLNWPLKWNIYILAKKYLALFPFFKYYSEHG